MCIRDRRAGPVHRASDLDHVDLLRIDAMLHEGAEQHHVHEIADAVDRDRHARSFEVLQRLDLGGVDDDHLGRVVVGEADHAHVGARFRGRQRGDHVAVTDLGRARHHRLGDHGDVLGGLHFRRGKARNLTEPFAHRLLHRDVDAERCAQGVDGERSGRARLCGHPGGPRQREARCPTR